VIVAVWAVSSDYLEGHLAGTGERSGMCFIERLFRGDSWWALLNVAVWDVSRGYGEGQLVGTGECGGMGCIEWLCRGTVGGHW